VLQLVLSSGAILTIGFTLFFGTENLRAQVAVTGTLSFLIVSGLTITAINHPFAGAVRVQPDASRPYWRTSVAQARRDRFGGSFDH
jgi:hypothetical protein